MQLLKEAQASQRPEDGQPTAEAQPLPDVVAPVRIFFVTLRICASMQA